MNTKRLQWLQNRQGLLQKCCTTNQGLGDFEGHFGYVCNEVSEHSATHSWDTPTLTHRKESSPCDHVVNQDPYLISYRLRQKWASCVGVNNTRKRGFMGWNYHLCGYTELHQANIAGTTCFALLTSSCTILRACVSHLVFHLKEEKQGCIRMNEDEKVLPRRFQNKLWHTSIDSWSKFSRKNCCEESTAPCFIFDSETVKPNLWIPVLPSSPDLTFVKQHQSSDGRSLDVHSQLVNA